MAASPRRVALVTDGQGWIVDRISRIYQSGIPGIDLFFLPSLNIDGLVHLARSYRILHFNNWFVRGFQPFFDRCPAKTVVSIRSFRFTPDVPQLRPSLFHVIHPDLQRDFDGAVFIPDGVDLQQFKPTRRLRVGIAYQPGHEEFKGVHLLRQAVDGLDVELVEASNLAHDAMKRFYESLDLYVCASLTEGFAAPVVECLALNVPVLSVRTGVASYLPGVDVVERTVAGLREGVRRHLTRDKVAAFDWPPVCAQVAAMYDRLLEAA